jgi:hypothetical protein
LRPDAKLNYPWKDNALLSAIMANTVSRYHINPTPSAVIPKSPKMGRLEVDVCARRRQQDPRSL